VTDAKSYFFPENLSLTELLLPLPLTESQARIKQRWWDNTFPQTVVGATLETVQMALAGTFLALFVAFPVGFLAARNTTPHPLVYHAVRGTLNFLRTIRTSRWALSLWRRWDSAPCRHVGFGDSHRNRAREAPVGIGGEY
jgi:ABC-type phosphate/phosphonate transport system permease subunit